MSARQVLVDVLLAVYRSRPAIGVREWAKKVVRLRPKESQSFPGPYDPSLTPCTDIVQDFATDPLWRECIVMKSSQSGFTLSVLTVIAYYVAHFALNIIYLIDSTLEARRISKTRLQPMLEDCVDTAGQISEGEDEMTNLTLYLKNCTIYLLGSYSSGALANKSAGLVVADELDKHPAQPDGEANSIDLARSRLKAVDGAKLLALSTPRGELDITNVEYRTGSRHKCFLPCPKCGHYQELTRDGLDYSAGKDLAGGWDLDRVLALTVYRCQMVGCGHGITDAEKPAMLAKKEWRATNLGQDEHKPQPGKMSVHISDLYSLLPSSTFGRLGLDCIEASKSMAKLKDVQANRFGLPWREKRTEIYEGDIKRMCGTYEHGHVPRLPAFVVVTVDVQKDVKKWTKTAFMRDGEAFVVDYGRTLSFDELVDVANTPVIVDEWAPQGRVITPEEDRINPVAIAGLIDEGFDTKNVREFCLRTRIDSETLLFYPCKGRGALTVRDVVEERGNFTQNGEQLSVYFFSDEDFKSELYLGRIAQFPKIQKGESSIPRLWFPRHLEAEFVSELTQEKRVQQMVRGRLRWIWEEPKHPNDFGDTVKMALVAWYKMKDSLIEAVPPAPAVNSNSHSEERGSFSPISL